MLGVLIALHSTFVGHVGFLLSRDMKSLAENAMGDSWNGVGVWQIGSLSIVVIQYHHALIWTERLRYSENALCTALHTMYCWVALCLCMVSQ